MASEMIDRSPAMPDVDRPRTFSSIRPRVRIVNARTSAPAVAAYETAKTANRLRSRPTSQIAIASGAQTALVFDRSASAARTAAPTVGAGRAVLATIPTANTCSRSGNPSPRMSIPAPRPVWVVRTSAGSANAIGRGHRCRRSSTNIATSSPIIAA